MSLWQSSYIVALIRVSSSVTQQPYKTPYYAALLRLLHDPGSLEGDLREPQSSPSLGKQVLEDFWKGFQGYLDKLSWRDIRLCVSRYLLFYAFLTERHQIHFFAHLTVAQVISIESLAALLQSFAAVLDEFGVSHGRGKNAALCAAEGLMIVWFPFACWLQSLMKLLRPPQ